MFFYEAVAVTIPHIQFRQTQSISANPALERSAMCRVSVGVVIVRGRVLEQAIDLFGRAVSRLPTEIQPPLPVQSMVGFRLAADLVSEAKPASFAHQRSYPRVQPRLVLDVVQADRADDEIERITGKVQLFETRHEAFSARAQT